MDTVPGSDQLQPVSGILFSGPKGEEPEEKKAALTFDDGPHPSYTPSILDILEEYEVSATFFVLGLQIEAHTELLKQAAEKGHEIGNHSYSHREFRWLSWTEVMHEIQRTERLIKDNTGTKPDLIRPPYGEITTWQLQQLKAKGYKIVNWSVDPRDWNPNYYHPNTIINQIDKNLHPGAIIILHDGGGDRSRTVAALPQIIELIEGRGYRLLTVSELLAAGEE